jgi:hypothetical protein
MAEFGRHCSAQPLRFRGAPAFPTLRVLQLDQCAHLEALYFENWDVLGRPLVGARLPPSQLEGPRIFALPGLDLQSDAGRVFGFGRRRGLIALRPLEFAA